MLDHMMIAETLETRRRDLQRMAGVPRTTESTPASRVLIPLPVQAPRPRRLIIAVAPRIRGLTEILAARMHAMHSPLAATRGLREADGPRGTKAAIP